MEACLKGQNYSSVVLPISEHIACLGDNLVLCVVL